MLLLNLRSGFILARAVLPAMLKQSHGSIINVAAKAAVDHGAGAAAYAASKAAAVALMDSLAADTKATGVRVNSILPTVMRRAQTGARCRTPTLIRGRARGDCAGDPVFVQRSSQHHSRSGRTGLRQSLNFSPSFVN